jgi:hypothetical protein
MTRFATLALLAALVLAVPAYAKDHNHGNNHNGKSQSMWKPQGAGSQVVVRDHRTPPVVRDHRKPEVIVRDHRQPTPPPVIRDHRTPAPPVVVRDHRTPAPPVVVRDHRTPAPVVVRDHRTMDASQASGGVVVK